MLYYPGFLEDEPQDRVDAVVAHELAHVLLHAHAADRTPSKEREADEKIITWGYEPAYEEGKYPA